MNFPTGILCLVEIRFSMGNIKNFVDSINKKKNYSGIRKPLKLENPKRF